jgi:hypothetical protein
VRVPVSTRTAYGTSFFSTPQHYAPTVVSRSNKFAAALQNGFYFPVLMQLNKPAMPMAPLVGQVGSVVRKSDDGLRFFGKGVTVNQVIDRCCCCCCFIAQYPVTQMMSVDVATFPESADDLKPVLYNITGIDETLQMSALVLSRHAP